MSQNESHDSPRTALELPCVTRRQFMIHGSVATIAIVLAGCGLTSTGPTAPGSVNMTLNISDYPPLANVGGVAYIDASGNPIAVVRTGSATFDALSRICPHQGGTVNASSGGFTCPVHGARFSDSGTWVGGQPTSNLTSYQTQFNSSTGVLTIG